MQRAFEREFGHLRTRVGKAAPVEPLHDEVAGAVLELAEIENLDDVLVADLVGGFGLGEKARDDLGILRQLGVQDLDGDPPHDARMLGEINRPHAALADLPAHDIVADGSPFHLSDGHSAGLDPRGTTIHSGFFLVDSEVGHP